MMRTQTDLLKLGSEAFNRDVSDIKWLVGTIKGILEAPTILKHLPTFFSLRAVLFEESEDATWGIEIKSLDRMIHVSLFLPSRGEQYASELSWDQLSWGLINPVVPPNVAARMAGNLDALLEETQRVLLVQIGTRAEHIFNSLLLRGAEENIARRQ